MPAVDKNDRTLPLPLRAGIGLVAAGVERAKRLPDAAPGGLARLAELPVRGLAFFATAREAAERTYEELANRGETVVARWRQQPEPRQTTRAPVAPTHIDLTEHVDVTDDVKPGATLSHDELPLDDYDHLTLGSLRARLARLDLVALVQLRDYERVHADRIQVMTMLENRIAKVTAST
ncbi:MAG: hypothetical protein QOE45_3343 [Frankiaceae bacterium]|jgi:hypothetical protein|nr:hypothetical protein [Frankiaceae bacterium]